MDLGITFREQGTAHIVQAHLGWGLELLRILLLSTPIAQHALPSGIIFRMGCLVCKVDDLVPQAFAIASQDV